jgi:hypothetical protein
MQIKNLLSRDRLLDTPDERACREFFRSAYLQLYADEAMARGKKENAAAYKRFCDTIDEMRAKWPQYDFIAGG